jgi:hypothetical protein
MEAASNFGFGAERVCAWRLNGLMIAVAARNATTAPRGIARNNFVA